MFFEQKTRLPLFGPFFKLDLEIVNLGHDQKCSCTALRLSLIYSCTKFQNLISLGSQVMACLDLFIKLDLEIVNLSQGKKCSCPAPRLSLIYSCSKFQNLISKGFQVIAWTNLEEEEEEEEN